MNRIVKTLNNLAQFDSIGRNDDPQRSVYIIEVVCQVSQFLLVAGLGSVITTTPTVWQMTRKKHYSWQVLISIISK